MYKILIDADGCPVVDETIELAQTYAIPVLLVCDTSHIFFEPYAKIVMADKGKDQSDFLLLKYVEKNDIVITQDYGLAALVLAKEARALHQNGFEFHKDNIEELLNRRHEHANMRKHKQYGHLSKRTKENDDDFYYALESMIVRSE